MNDQAKRVTEKLMQLTDEEIEMLYSLLKTEKEKAAAIQAPAKA